MAIGLDIYDPVRVQLLDDIVQKLIDKDVKITPQLRIEAMSCIVQLRKVIRNLAPPGSQAEQRVRVWLFPEESKMIYWEEHAAEEYRKIAERKKDEAGAIAYIGA